MSNYMKRVKETRDKLNEIGPGFCLMKWYNQTLYLQTGDNHSCYHPRPHHIPVESLKDNPAALHNTDQKLQQRKAMLEGKKPSECYYCWNVEDLEGEHFSDRMFHSASSWLDAKKETDKIKTMPWDQPVNPMYLEVSWGNACNFACGYCCPQASSMWVDEIKKHGNYDISYNQYGIDFLNNGNFYDTKADNPYINAFWEWWPELKKTLKVLRLTGGEPLMNTNTMKMLELLDKHPEPNLELHLNSNLGVTNRRVVAFAEKVQKLLTEGKIKDFKLYTSIDAWGEQAEYMRRGLKCELWEQNLNSYLEIVPNQDVSFMITYNILSVATFKKLLEQILVLRKKYNVNGQRRIGFDTPYLKEPPHWTMNILPKEFGKYIDDDLQYIQDNLDEMDITKFSQHEYEKLKRVRDYFYDGGPAVTEASVNTGRKDFYTFFIEYDKRSNSDLLTTFPMYTDFMQLCKETYEKDNSDNT